MKTLIISADDIYCLVQKLGIHALMDEMIERLTKAFSTYCDDNITIPARSGFQYSQPEIGLLEWMPSMKNGSHATVKMVGYHPTNPQQRNLPTILSTVSAYDTSTGHLLGLADATFLTALRTGAASAIASRILAKPCTRRVGLIGGGAQALTQLHALSRVFSVEEVFVYDIDPESAQAFKSGHPFWI